MLEKSLIMLMFLSLFVWMAAPAASAQGGMNPKMAMPNYDLKTETTVKGTIKEVENPTMSSDQPVGRGQMKGMNGMGRMGGRDAMTAMGGVHLQLETEKGLVTVHLGPAKYLADKKFVVAAGDSVEILGSMVKMGGDDVLIAREIKKGSEKLILRDGKGLPMWSGAKAGK